MANRSRVVGTLDRRARPLIDPRDGDIETDASSLEHRSLLALAGSLFTEVSLPKLAIALILLAVVPAVLLGLAPIVATIWLGTFASTPTGALSAAAFVCALLAIAWFGGRKLVRLAEQSFWSLNALVIQPGYAAWRESLLHLSSRLVGTAASETKRARVRAAASAIAGVVICLLALVVLRLIWPWTHWVGTLADLRTPHWLTLTALANAIAVAAGYLAIVSVIWGIADASMPQPRESIDFRPATDFVRSWRVAHLSDLHVVGERYGFRLGSGRAGPRGNELLVDALKRLDEVHRRQPVDAIVITGDLTDAGTAPEWAELLDIFNAFPRLVPLVVAMPGNHDVNIVDRANPARLDLPTSPNKRLRQVRTVSALGALQGTHVRVRHDEAEPVGDTLDGALAPKASDLIAFADKGSRRLASTADVVWRSVFPMILPPDDDDGLGIAALNSNAETHFSFTNALGLVPADEAHALIEAIERYPRACWIVALHHHIVEHPALGHGLSGRIGTTLINGNWFTRTLQRVAHRAVVMHGHRHIDWMGECGDLLILSAPSSAMPTTDGDDVYFYVHTVGVDASGRIGLGLPERIEVNPRVA